MEGITCGIIGILEFMAISHKQNRVHILGKSDNEY